LKIGVLSDTHGWFHPGLPEALSGCEVILHAGDLGDADVLEQLQELAPVRLVVGNIDGEYVRRRYPTHDRFDLSGLRFWMTHIAGHPDRWRAGIGLELRANPPDILICGHSHILRIERVPSLGRMLFLNPGAAGRQGFHQVKTCVLLYLEPGKATRAEVVHLDG
jgi:uncharacterized protein